MSVWTELEIERVEPARADAIIFRLSGALSDSKHSYLFLEKVKKEVENGRRYLVINFKEVTRMTSSGIGILCACYTTILGVKGSMSVVGVTERNRALLNAVGLWDRLDAHDSEDDLDLG